MAAAAHCELDIALWVVSAFETLTDKGIMDAKFSVNSLTKNKKSNDPGWIEIILYVKAILIEVLRSMSTSTKDYPSCRKDLVDVIAKHFENFEKQVAAYKDDLSWQG